MNRAELVNSITKKGFRPDGRGGFTKEPLSKSNVISHETSPVATKLYQPQPEYHARKTLGAHEEAKAGGKTRTSVCITRCSPRLLDLDNAFGGAKGICDELRYSGLIVDDNTEEIELTIRQEKVSKEKEGTLIEITYP